MEIQMRRKEIHQSGSLDLARSVFVCMCVGGGGRGCLWKRVCVCLYVCDTVCVV